MLKNSPRVLIEEFFYTVSLEMVLMRPRFVSAFIIRDSACRVGESACVVCESVYGFYERASTSVSGISVCS